MKNYGARILTELLTEVKGMAIADYNVLFESALRDIKEELDTFQDYFTTQIQSRTSHSTISKNFLKIISFSDFVVLPPNKVEPIETDEYLLNDLNTWTNARAA
jgi:hypothetical protein